jgi:hypothetical protein
MSEKKEFQKKEWEQVNCLSEKKDASDFRKACAKKGVSKNAVLNHFIKRFNKKHL